MISLNKSSFLMELHMLLLQSGVRQKRLQVSQERQARACLRPLEVDSGIASTFQRGLKGHLAHVEKCIR